MKLGIIMYSSDAEVVWNVFRFGNFSLKEGDTTKIFLMAKGVEYEVLNNDKLNINEQARLFLDNGGKILACGTCLKIRESDGSEMCPISTMKDLYEMVKECDKVISF